MIWFRLVLVVGLGFQALSLCAQQGDKVGEAQASRIPKEKIPPSPPLPPEEALKTIKAAPGFRVELVASEPMVEVPIIVQFDPDGRLWVVEMRGFMPTPDGLGETNPVGRISILTDKDGDGRMDEKKVFLDGLVLPRAFLLVQDGALVCEPPNLWFYPNQNDKPGERILVADDFAKDADPKLGVRMNLEHSGNSLLLALDNWIYSLYHPFRYRFEQGKWRREPVPQRAQWGLSQDDFGRLFYTSNSDQLRGDVVPGHYFGGKPGKLKAPGIGVQIAKDQNVWPIRINPGVNRGYQTGTLREDGTLWKFTAACGTCIYRGDLFPKNFYGNAFICEPSANVIRRNILTEREGVVTAENPYNKAEFVASTDELFRPVNLTTGPDGALYIADMYHGIIQHRFFLTTYLRQQAQDRGLDKVISCGRIWRVVPEDKAVERKASPALARAKTADLISTLDDPNGWRRDTAQRLLVERRDVAAKPALEKLASVSPNPVTRLHALWSLEGMHLLEPSTIESALADAEPKVRAAAIRLSETPLRSTNQTSNTTALRSKVLGLVDDTNADVQIQLALTLGLLPKNDQIKATAATLAKNAQAPLARDAAAYTVAGYEPVKAEPVKTMKGRPLTAVEQKRFETGKTMYEATCLACHQQHGMGQPGLAPPLVGSEWVSFSDGRLIRIILHGLRGPITVKGEPFEMDMPSLGVLDDEQIASALTYIRREWGHTFEPVSPEAVKKVREETSKREDAWTALELLKIP